MRYFENFKILKPVSVNPNYWNFKFFTNFKKYKNSNKPRRKNGTKTRRNQESRANGRGIERKKRQHGKIIRLDKKRVSQAAACAILLVFHQEMVKSVEVLW